MRPQSMSAVIAPLEEMGFVAGAADPNDGRKNAHVADKSLQKRIEDGRAARQDWLTQAIQQKLSPQEQKKLSSAIHLLAKSPRTDRLAAHPAIRTLIHYFQRRISCHSPSLTLKLRWSWWIFRRAFGTYQSLHPWQVSSTILVSLSRPFASRSCLCSGQRCGTAPGRTEEPRRHREFPSPLS